MKTFNAFLAACVAVLGLCSLLLLVFWMRDNHALNAANLKLERELELAHSTIATATQQSEEATRQLKDLQASTAQLRDRLDGLESPTNATATQQSEEATRQLKDLQASTAQLRDRLDNLESPNNATGEPFPQPYRVRAFVGRESLGEAWIIPHNVKRDPETGHYRFEPVLWMTEDNKRKFTVQHTNVVERQVASTAVNNYYPSPYYYYPYYGGRPWSPGGTNRPSSRPHPPVGSQPPVQVTTGAQPNFNARMFAPPFSTVNSRPQALGRPATSEINARVFAP